MRDAVSETGSAATPIMDRLTKTPTLWVLFVATLLVTLSFPLAASIWNLTFIDAVASPADVEALIAQMDDDQKTAHAWVTATLDVLYPLVYGALFAGTAWRFFPAWPWLAAPGLLAVPVDLVEGVVQVLALTDTADLIVLKAWVTPLKTALFLIALAIAAAGWATWLISRFRNNARE